MIFLTQRVHVDREPHPAPCGGQLTEDLADHVRAARGQDEPVAMRRHSARIRVGELPGQHAVPPLAEHHDPLRGAGRAAALEHADNPRMRAEAARDQILHPDVAQLVGDVREQG
jgi:hypothetical protein